MLIKQRARRIPDHSIIFRDQTSDGFAVVGAYEVDGNIFWLKVDLSSLLPNDFASLENYKTAVIRAVDSLAARKFEISYAGDGLEASIGHTPEIDYLPSNNGI